MRKHKIINKILITFLVIGIILILVTLLKLNNYDGALDALILLPYTITGFSIFLLVAYNPKKLDSFFLMILKLYGWKPFPKNENLRIRSYIIVGYGGALFAIIMTILLIMMAAFNYSISLL